MILKVILLIAIAELLDLGGQILYKKSLNTIKAENYIHFLKSALSSSRIWAGFVIIAASMVIWLTALAQTELNIFYSLDSMQYLLILGASRLLLGEKITLQKAAATLFVVIGIVMVAMS